MICSNCKNSNASFFYTQNINGKETSVALCQNCAAKAGIGNTMVSPLFGSLFANAKANKKATSSAKRCTLCALTFNDILKMGKVGCPECYNSFKEELKDTIRSIHGMAKHIGLTPNGTEKLTTVKKELSEEDVLREQLNEAIKAENYEEAANLRDKIKALKGEV
ncbi:MAG: hypothetical protein E7598_02835 [Ruminococcaceae bacterium]|nr:hypothetical protein [Oscillospiraceae bacterium]